MPDLKRVKEESARILALVGGDAAKAFDIIERQFGVLVMRTQVVLSLSGIVITVTGFSGRKIAETSNLARLLISGGMIIVLFAATVAILGVLRVTWLTQELAEDPREMVESAIVLRDRKARFLAIALALFVAGFGAYVVAVAQLLLAAQPPA